MTVPNLIFVLLLFPIAGGAAEFGAAESPPTGVTASPTLEMDGFWILKELRCKTGRKLNLDSPLDRIHIDKAKSEARVERHISDDCVASASGQYKLEGKELKVPEMKNKSCAKLDEGLIVMHHASIPQPALLSLVIERSEEQLILNFSRSTACSSEGGMDIVFVRPSGS